MNSSSASDAHENPPHRAEESGFRPDSASIIHAVATRRDSTGTMKDRESQQREQVERTNVGLLLHALHEIADTIIPPEQRRLVQEGEVTRAMALLRRFTLLQPAVRLEQLLTHCEAETARDRNLVAHLVDPFQLRHVLTFHLDAPGAGPTADCVALERLVEHGPVAEIEAWFARIGTTSPGLPGSALGGLRAIFARRSRAFAPAAHLERLSFETAVLTLQSQGVVGFEDTRLFFSLLKQIGGPTVPGLEHYLQSAEISHAANQHRATGNTAAAEHFRNLARAFDPGRLPALEQHLFATIEARTTPPRAPADMEAPETGATPPPEPRRGLFSGLKNLGQSIIPRC